MGTKSLHIIQKQVFDITLPDMRTALEWETRECQGFTEMVRDQLERCFDEFNGTGDHLIIEKLKLDLGAFTLKDMHLEMPERLYSGIRKMLEDHLKDMPERGSFFGRDNSVFGPEEGNKKDRLYTDRQARLEALCFFLDNGYLPWWASGLSNWDEPWLQQLTEFDMNRFSNFLASGKDTTILRLAAQFSDEFIQHLIKSLGISVNPGEAWHWLKRVLEELTKIKISEPEISKDIKSVDSSTFPQRLLSLPLLRRQYWFQWTKHALGRSAIPNLHHLLGDHQEILVFIRLLMQNKSIYGVHLAGEPPNIWKEELELLWDETMGEDKSLKQPTIQGSAGNAAGKDDSVFVEKPPISDLRARGLAVGKNIKQAEQGEMLFVNEAGLVLLHPFLPQLFRNCSWLDKDNYLNGFGKAMGVYALYYLATGKTVAAEHQLLVPKLLMGIPWENPLEPVEELNDTHKTACNELLTEVVKHWKALRNTSPDGLREAYLQRTGKLEFNENGWRLVVEKKTQDILLSRLPWGISIIKLPWMEGILTVTWQ